MSLSNGEKSAVADIINATFVGNPSASAAARWRSPLTEALQGLYWTPPPPVSGAAQTSER